MSRSIMPRSVRVLLLIALLSVLALTAYEGQRLAGVGSAFAAKYLCSAVFVGGRNPDQVARVDLPAFRSAVVDLVDWQVDVASGTTTADIFGLGRREARYRPGLGCTVAIDLVPATVPVPARSPRNRQTPSPRWLRPHPPWKKSSRRLSVSRTPSGHAAHGRCL